MDLKLVQRFLPYAAIAVITTLSLWSRRSRRSRAQSGWSNDSDDDEAEVSSPPNDSDDDEAEVSSPPVREDGFQYDVFLSFRGPDTRKTFADLLYEALKVQGILTFIDSEKLEKEQKLEVLLECIQRSKIFVPIFSSGYADSEWRLKEIAKMVECERVIVPVYVDVEPTDVRRQTGPFKSAFSKHRRNKAIDETEVSNWSNALKEAGRVSGYITTNSYLGKLIQAIVQRILSEVNKTSKLLVAQHPVGLDSRLLDVMNVLEIEAQDDVRMVGIYGMGGIGKTTLATAVCNEISSRFDACSFISNVREAAERPSGLVSLQKQLLADVFNDKYGTISNINDGLGKIKERVGAKKVMLVLDDVNDVSQIHGLVGQLEWFRSGSRIIITTRDKRVLTSARVKENHVYELKGLDDIQSLELFSWHAFRKKEPDAKFAVLSNEVASTAAGLPLSLKIFGSHFFDLETVEDWRDMLKKMKEDLDRHIYERLRISFDGLDENEKKVFLDIACFFVGQETKRATLMWEACRFFPAMAINQLIHKSLVSINNEGKFEMHDHVRDMGRKIVQANAEEAGKYSRLWKDDETVDVLQNERGTEDVEAIKLFCEGKDSVYVNLEYLAAMPQLRMLLLEGVTLKGRYEHFPQKLRWLKWSSEALEKFPSTLHLKVFNQLKVLDLSGCSKLNICPDFTSMIHLEMLGFSGCVKMNELHPSVGLLIHLTHLSLSHCSSLKELPQEVWQLTKLQEFDLSCCFGITTFPSLKQHFLGELKVLKLDYCRNLTMCPDFVGMPRLEILDFEACWKMSEIPPSIGHLKSLTNLNLSYCESLKELPQEVWQLTSLQELDLHRCNQIAALPSLMPNAESLQQPLLERLDMSHCSDLITSPDFTSTPHLQELHFRSCKKITKLDPSIGQLKRLMYLDLIDCKSLEELPQEIGQLTSLRRLALNFCSQISTLPQSMGHLKQLQFLFLSYCSSLKQVPECIMSLDQLEVLDVDFCERLKSLPLFPPSLNELDASHCRQLESMADVSSLKGLEKLSLRGCIRLEDIPGIEQLKCLKRLHLGECRRLADSFFKRVQDLDNLEELELRNWEDLTKRPDVTSFLYWLSNLKYLRELDLCWTDIEELPALERLRVLSVIHCNRLKSLPWLPPSFIKLNATSCTELSMIEDVSSVEGLTELNLTGCRKLVHIPGVEQLKGLKKLELGGCRSLYDSFFERLQEANFQHLQQYSIPGRLINDGSSDPQSITFILPRQFHCGLLCLYVDQRSQEKGNSASTLPDKSVASEDEVIQPVDSQLDRSVVHIDITTDDAQFSFPTFIIGWDKSRTSFTATFAWDNELMMMADQGRFKGNDVNDDQGKGMMQMRVSIDGCILLHGDLLMTEWSVTDKDLDPCRVGHNIVQVKFG